MNKLQTIGEREAALEARAAAEADPGFAYRWSCPLCESQSPLYIHEDAATDAFDAHLGGHSIQDAFRLIKASLWLTSFALTEQP